MIDFGDAFQFDLEFGEKAPVNGVVTETAVDTKSFETKPEQQLHDEEKRVAETIRIRNRHLFHRMTSDRDVEELMPREVSEDDAYHVISYGDVDSLSYLHWILRLQDVDRMLASTWCLAMTDIKEFERDLKLGKIGKLDFYLGEIFKYSFPAEWFELNEVCKIGGGRLCVLRNHAKVMAGYGKKFAFVIESSANINTNPRIEQTVVTISKPLADFYFDFFGGLETQQRKCKRDAEYEQKRKS